MKTNNLIEQLANNVAPIRRLAAPWTRALLWFAVAVPYVTVIVVMMAPRNDLAEKLVNTHFLVEQIAALLTAVTAAAAAFASVIPGYDRRLMLLPTIPLSVWLSSLGQGCIQTWIENGTALNITSDFACIPTIALVGALPAIAMVLMLRKGAPLRPHATAALGGLAAAGLGNFGLRLFHQQDASMMVLIWQMGTVFMLTAIAAWTGRLFLDWRPLVMHVRNNVRRD